MENWKSKVTDFSYKKIDMVRISNLQFYISSLTEVSNNEMTTTYMSFNLNVNLLIQNNNIILTLLDSHLKSSVHLHAS